MSTRNPSGQASSFDRMLDESRRQFEDLYRHAAPARLPSSPSDDSPPPAVRSAAQSLTNSDEDGEAFDAGATDVGQMLASRFGDRWRYEITDRRQDGSDVVVWGRLHVADAQQEKVRRGRATIQAQREVSKVVGRSGGLEFALTTDRKTGGDGEAAAVKAAFDQAATAALEACAKGL